jgi:hypothetical protein
MFEVVISKGIELMSCKDVMSLAKVLKKNTITEILVPHNYELR